MWGETSQWSLQEYRGPKLYAWNGRLIQQVLKFKGQDCPFVKLKSNVDHMWYEQADRVIALGARAIAHTTRQCPVTLDCCPNLPFLDQNDEACSVKVGSAAPTSRLCEVCQRNVALQAMQHTLVDTSSLESALAMSVLIVVAMIAPHKVCAIYKVGLC